MGSGAGEAGADGRLRVRPPLRVARRGRRLPRLLGRALAIAPAGGGAMAVGEVSPSAQAQGVRAGMALSDALARAPQLELIAGDPIKVARGWDQAARALEGIGAQLELARPGLAYFLADGLQGIHGGRDGVIAAAGEAMRRRPRIGRARRGSSRSPPRCRHVVVAPG